MAGIKRKYTKKSMKTVKKKQTNAINDKRWNKCQLYKNTKQKTKQKHKH